MARMYPSKEYTDFHNSSAERVVFELLEKELPDEYAIFHSEDWFRAPGQSKRDQLRGEIDFLVCHPEKGLLIVEVKGGGIGYDVKTNTWYTVNDSGRHELDKSPAVQAEAGMYNLLERLKENPRIEGQGKFSGVVGWAIFFADMNSQQGRSLPDMNLPYERLLFDDDKAHIQESLEKLFDFWDQQVSFTGPLDRTTWERLTEVFLRREFQIIEGLGNYITKSQKKLLRATEEQKRILQVLSNQREAFISGPAGSGKTLLSLEKARRLALEGKRVLWLCYNKNLSEHVKQHYDEGIFEVSRFHSFGLEILNEAGIKFKFPNQKYDNPRSEEWDRFFREEIPELMADAVGMIARRYDAIIIDEGQDFADNWILVLEEFFKDSENRWFYLFYDPHQTIFHDDTGWIEESERLVYPLQSNVRNTREIARVALNLGEVEDEIKFGPPGKQVRVDLAETDKQLVDQLRRAVHELIYEEKLDPDNLVILTGRSKNKGPLAGVKKLCEHRVVKQGSTGRQQLLCNTIQGFKGLESDVVLLVIPELSEKQNLVWYTGASRARHLLWIFTRDPLVENRVIEAGR